MLKQIAWIVGGALVLALAIQLVPYGRNHTNPPVVKEPTWDSPETKALAQRACYDCHSNETTWPWYSNIAPISWLVQRDVDQGRRQLNFSQFDRPPREPGQAAREVQRGDMPPWYYVIAHPNANLSTEEKQALIQGLQATLGTAGGGGRQTQTVTPARAAYQP
jgi:hypothetical protein